MPGGGARAHDVIANTHAQHTPRLLEAAELGYRFAICEKPVAVDLDQIGALEGLPLATWICHGYRLLWGPQELKRALAAGRFGRLVSIEGRYWQSSATRTPAVGSWKDSPKLAGRFDVLLDLATHWADLVTHIYGRLPDRTSVRRWFVNAASPHRDTHVHLTMEFGDLIGFGSVSKTVHGEGNKLELEILGEHASASWSFEQPDVITWGEGRSRSTQVRTEADLPARPLESRRSCIPDGHGGRCTRYPGHPVTRCPGFAATPPDRLRPSLAVLDRLIPTAPAIPAGHGGRMTSFPAYATKCQPASSHGRGGRDLGQGARDLGRDPGSLGLDPRSLGQDPRSFGRDPRSLGQGPRDLG